MYSNGNSGHILIINKNINIKIIKSIYKSNSFIHKYNDRSNYFFLKIVISSLSLLINNFKTLK